jgi:peptidoglycan hydrolase CwlO-like protein
VILPTGIVVGTEGPFAGIKEKMASISETERENLQNLFVLSQQIEEMEKDEERITRDIETKNGEIEGLKATIAGEEIAYTKKLEALKQVLKSYQRMGPGTYLETILNSDNLAMLLRRINTLRDLTRNTGKLMELLEESKAKLITEKTNLAERITLMEDKQNQLRESLTKKKQLIEDQEKYLASLKEKREYYQENLANLQQNWDELKTSIPVIIKELSNIIDEGNIPPEKLNISYNFTSISGSIDEKTLNDIISGHPLLPKIAFSLYPSNVEIGMPDKNLVLSGIFVIQESHTFKFQVKEGSFYGIPLDAGAIEDLFLKGDLVFNLKPLSNFTINSIKMMDGYLELTITPNY